MIQFIDEAIETLLRREVPLPEPSVDISFAAPDRAWGAGLTRPTVNVFLWDVRRSLSRMTAGLAQKSADGQVARRPVDPVVDLRYLVTAWASEHRDEHQLLGSVLRCLLANSSVPAAYVPPQVPPSSPLSVSLASEESRVPGEFWSSLDGRLKPGLQVVVSLSLNVYDWAAAAAPPGEISLASSSMEVAPAPPGTRAPGGAEVAPRPGALTAGPAHAGGQSVPVFRRRRSSGVLTMEGRPAAVESGGGAVPAGDGD